MKKLIIFFLLYPVCLFAQKGTEHYSCCQGHNPCVYIYGSSNLAKHNCQVHGIGCNSSGTSSGTNGKIGTPFLFGMLVGGGAGGAYGSTKKDENGQSKTLDYALIGGLGAGIVSAAASKIFSAKGKKGGYSLKFRKLDNRAKLYFSFSGNRAGLIARL